MLDTVPRKTAVRPPVSKMVALRPAWSTECSVAMKCNIF